MKANFIFLFSLIALASCNSATSSNPTAEEIMSKVNIRTMNAGKHAYALDVPEGWDTTHRTDNGINYYVLSAPSSQDSTGTSINISTENMQHRNLDTYFEKCKMMLKKLMPGAEILSQGTITANGIEGKWLNYNMEMQGIKLNCIFYTFPKDGAAYDITACTVPEQAARYRNLFDSVARSFRFTD